MGEKKMLRLCIANVYSIAENILHVLGTALIRSSPFFTLVKIPNQPTRNSHPNPNPTPNHSPKKKKKISRTVDFHRQVTQRRVSDMAF